MPRGITVAEGFGLANARKHECNLERLWLEIPLKKENAGMYHFHPIDKSVWKPYWKNKEILFDNQKILASFWEYIDVLGEKQRLLICANLTGEEVLDATLDFDGKVTMVNGNAGCEGKKFSFKPYTYAMLYLN